MRTEQPTSCSAVISTALLAVCRADFLKYIKTEQAHREPPFRMSIKAHRKGMHYGFDHPGLQIKWVDYRAGWLSGQVSKLAVVI